MSEEVFDIDEQAGAFQPVKVKLRGEVYTLGATALSLMNAAELGSDDEDGEQHMLAKLRPMLAELCPEMPTQDLTAGEEVALMRAVTEVMRRVGRLTFRAEDGEGGDEG